MSNTINNLIAQREYKKSNRESVIVYIGAPEKDPNSESFFCPFLIDGLDGKQIPRAYGADSVQALILVLETIGIYLNTSQSAKVSQLRWEGSYAPDYIGFPVPENIRDLVK